MTREKVEQERAVALNAARRLADDLRVQAHDEASASIAEAVRPDRSMPHMPEGPVVPEVDGATSAHEGQATERAASSRT